MFHGCGESTDQRSQGFQAIGYEAQALDITKAVQPEPSLGLSEFRLPALQQGRAQSSQDFKFPIHRKQWTNFTSFSNCAKSKFENVPQIIDRASPGSILINAYCNRRQRGVSLMAAPERSSSHFHLIPRCVQPTFLGMRDTSVNICKFPRALTMACQGRRTRSQMLLPCRARQDLATCTSTQFYYMEAFSLQV